MWVLCAYYSEPSNLEAGPCVAAGPVPTASISFERPALSDLEVEGFMRGALNFINDINDSIPSKFNEHASTETINSRTIVEYSLEPSFTRLDFTFLGFLIRVWLHLQLWV